MEWLNIKYINNLLKTRHVFFSSPYPCVIRFVLEKAFAHDNFKMGFPF